MQVSDLAFHAALGKLVADVGHADFWRRLTTFLRRQVAFDTWVAMIFQPGRRPVLLAGCPGDAAAEALLRDYLARFHLLDPFCRFALSGPEAGLYRIDDVAPELFRQTEYYQTYYRHMVDHDEAQFLVPVEGGRVISLSLGSHGVFSAADMGGLQLYAAWVLPLMALAVRLEAGGAEAGGEDVEAVLERLGRPRLTAREMDVMVLMQAGHATKSIARSMRISPHTIKVHRRNIYEKLGVSTQAEVFALLSGRMAR
ncbi:helix-turn-helix transcriptional regulator [Komagataeibacter swingsii]|uniref:Helix-turn-helix transcriptional regulator n=1 Tax=Komagataeibacter swingsii TaxID=215220 RepID=A0A850P1B9_9PROT|nr:helix-turn-helix transcriptional regulator [Komagataeibacter swingsii]AHI25854.1 transcriptional regulator, LuxR family [Komagataeibacter xylinus E25]NVN37364.1 helix-turn-helix transcriptional regulator [Komagataeibacter swingsii]RFP06172.1 helix-turn-helix transcriptional regulator [Komagataeibacter xylinus]RFP06992.1 helix-turn-helix transcriptional regulator [Komagataeibacter xylinus]